MEQIRFGGRRAVGFGVGDAEDDPCSVGLFMGFFGKSIELSVLKSEDAQIADYMTSLNASISGPCPTMREVDKGSWQTTFRKWQTLHTAVRSFLESPPWVGYNLEAAKWLCRLNNVRDQANVFQPMSVQCNPNATPNIPPHPKNPSEPDDWFGFGSVGSTIRTVSVVVAGLTGVYVLVPIVRETVAAHQRHTIRRLSPAPEPST